MFSMYPFWISDPDAVIETNQPEVQPNLTYAERPVRIVDHKEKVLRNKTIKYVRVMWSGQTEREATWELEDAMRTKYPELFLWPGMLIFEDENSFKGGGMKWSKSMQGFMLI